MAIKITLEVCIERFKEPASDKGNFTAQGMTLEIKKIVGAVEEQFTIFAPSGGNSGSILFLTKDPQLVKKTNAAGKRTTKDTGPKMSAQELKEFREFQAWKASQSK